MRPSGTTIAAVSSPPGPARRGILRLSGPRTHSILATTLTPGFPPDAPRTALPTSFHDGIGPQPALALWMPGPHSYTREDVAELHLPGNPFLLDRALARVVTLGAEPAAPGEFTRRAFLNGRLDLTRAEAVLELVQATNESERRSATRLLAGGLERRISALRDALEDVRALCEASLDFDEADTGHVSPAQLGVRIDAIAVRLDEALRWEVGRQAPSALPRVVLCGAPNAGKSSLFNTLTAGRALVSPHPGTTRDALESLWSVEGGACLLLDAPGLAPSARGADASAQRLASVERRAADLVLWVIDGACGDPTRSQGERASLPDGVPVVVAWNKIDRTEAVSEPDAAARELFDDRAATLVRVSARTGEGLASLAVAVARGLGLARDVEDGAGPVGGLARELFARHRRSLEEASAGVDQARARLADGTPLDLVAETLRAATVALDGISGRTSPEDLLDRIFASFCIGK